MYLFFILVYTRVSNFAYSNYSTYKHLIYSQYNLAFGNLIFKIVMILFQLEELYKNLGTLFPYQIQFIFFDSFNVKLNLEYKGTADDEVYYYSLYIGTKLQELFFDIALWYSLDFHLVWFECITSHKSTLY